MAERRMFSKQIIDSDAFLEMPCSTQALYFHLSMRADDDGFINNPKMIMRTIGASEDDMKLLLVKKFILSFESGVIVIKHWRLQNAIRKDRYKETNYQDEKCLLLLDENGIYHMLATKWQPNDNQWLPQVRLGKDRLGKVSVVEDSIGKDSIEVGLLEIVEDIDKEKSEDSENPPNPPNFTRVLQFFLTIGGDGVEAKKFYSFYSKNNWHDSNRKPITNWKARAELWHKDQK